MRNLNINILLGKTVKNIEKRYNKDGEPNELLFICDDGNTYKMYHEWECCERVYLYDIIGDLSDLIGSEIRYADVRTNKERYEDNEYGSRTWTFYELATSKGYVTLRWIGESNGYYSEEVNFELISEEDI